jgi:hypothetical protein
LRLELFLANVTLVGIVLNNNNGKDAAGSQVHVCPFEQCRKKFFRLSKYQDHLNTHTRIEPYECQHNLTSGCIFVIVIIYFVCFYVLVHVLRLVEGFAAK